MFFDAFMKVDGVEGGPLDDGHKGWVELLYYHYSAMQSISQTASSNGGGDCWSCVTWRFPDQQICG